MSPSDARVSAEGARTTSVTTWATVSVAEPEKPSASAAIAAVPFSTAVASPDPSTVATEASPLDHAKLCTLSTAWPLASLASAARRTVSPSDARVSAAGVTTTAATCCSTVTWASPEAPPAVAVTVAVPLPTAATSPVPLTVATAASPVAQVTVTPVIAEPVWSRTVAASWTLSPTERSVADPGETVTVVATGGSLPHPPAPSQTTVARATVRRFIAALRRTRGCPG